MDTSRLEAFSDAVFAIAITLLVLGIDVPLPGASLGSGIVRLWPSYLAYVGSFLLLGAIWINHNAMFRLVARADATLLVLNLLQLMVFAFLPFPTAVLAAAFHGGAGERAAVALYGGTLLLGGAFVNAVWQAARSHQLLRAEVSPAEARQIGRRYLLGPLLYLIGIAVGLLLPWLALILYIGITGYFLWPSGIDSVAAASGAHAEPPSNDVPRS